MATPIDTIVVLDGILFQKETTSDVYTQDHATNSAVFTRGFSVPFPYKAARIIYNATFDPDGGRVHYRTRLLRTTSITTPTKTANEGDAWQAVTPSALAASVVVSSDFDVSASWDSILDVAVCQSSVTANTTGIEVILQGRQQDSVDDWEEIIRVIVLVLPAAVKSDFAAQEAAAQTTLSVTDPTTGKLNQAGKYIFLEDTATIAQCEIAYLTEGGADS